MRISRKLIALAGGLGLVGGALFWVLSAPMPLAAERLAAFPQGEIARGEAVFWAAGCASCHARDEATGDARLELAGGHVLKTPFGNFVAPNISSHPEDGIGSWSFEQFANAVMRGISPDGSHYYPAFPYTSYARMTDTDVADLYAYMKTLPSVEGKAPQSDVPFPFSVRRGVGMWKLVFLDDAHVVGDDIVGDDPVLQRGRYLVEALGHCGECHSPRTFGGAGGTDGTRWLAGGPAPQGDGRIPNITTGAGGISDWSEADIAYGLETGFTPEFDSMGSSMAEVVFNYAKVSEADRQAIAAYLKAIPPVDSAQ